MRLRSGRIISSETLNEIMNTMNTQSTSTIENTSSINVNTSATTDANGVETIPSTSQLDPERQILNREEAGREF